MTKEGRFSKVSMLLLTMITAIVAMIGPMESSVNAEKKKQREGADSHGDKILNGQYRIRTENRPFIISRLRRAV